MAPKFLGEFEQMVLLAILQLDDQAFGVGILRELDERAGRDVSRGTLYKTLERMEAKGLLEWRLEEGGEERGGNRKRRFSVTPRGMTALEETRRAFVNLWEGLEGLAGGSDS